MEGPTLDTNRDLMDWSTMKVSGLVNPEASFKCPTCGKVSSMHPNYIKLGISGCHGRGRCHKTIDIVDQMVRARGWSLITIQEGSKKGDLIIYYTKPGVTDHQCSIKFGTLRTGGQCKICMDNSKKSRVKFVPPPRPKCGCSGLGKGKGGGKLCPHYNHAVTYPNSARFFDYEKNFPIRPENISPHSHDIYWWKCPNEWCNMSFEQEPARRGCQNQECPYCSGKRVCEWNCLATTHPHLAAEFDSNNHFTPFEVNYGSHKVVNWICRKIEGEEHRWATQIHYRTLPNGATGCPWCSKKGYAAEIGGHTQFVIDARKIHGDLYTYPDDYNGNNIPIRIHCKILDSNGREHGLFRQTPSSHKSGNGCPLCSKSQTVSKGIRRIQDILSDKGLVCNIDWFPEYTFPGMVLIQPLRIDIYIPKYNLAIEYDGFQHFWPIEFFGGIDGFNKTRRRDITKDVYCTYNKINLLRFPPTTDDPADIKGFLDKIFDICAQGRQVYSSYKNLQDTVRAHVDLSGVIVVEIPEPTN
jgi:hypothetical protein